MTDWFILQSQPQQEAARITIAEAIARYWNERGQFTSHPPTVNTHCNYWLGHFGEKSVEDALAYAEQERFKTALLDGGLSPSDREPRHQYRPRRVADGVEKRGS